MSRYTHANRGRSLELTVIASQSDVIRVAKMNAGAKWAKGRVIATRGPVDFVGTVRATGRSICFDAKQSAEQRRFPIRQMLAAHQRFYLIDQGRAGAVAGLVIEATACRTFYWLDWTGMTQDDEASVAWTDDRLTGLGDTLHAIKFSRVPGIAGPPPVTSAWRLGGSDLRNN